MKSYINLTDIALLDALKNISSASCTFEQLVSSYAIILEHSKEISKYVTRAEELLNAYSESVITSFLGCTDGFSIRGKMYTIKRSSKTEVTKDIDAIKALGSLSSEYFIERKQQVFDVKKALADKALGSLPSSIDSLITETVVESTVIKEVK